MRFFLPAAFALAATLTPLARAQTPDKARLQKAAALPSIVISADFSLTPNRRLDAVDARDAPAAIAKLEKELKANRNDADRWRKLGALYTDAGRIEMAKSAYEKAIAILSPVKTRKPVDGAALGRLGDCYRQVGLTAEAEDVLRKAVQVAPGDWNAWVSLGGILEERGWHALALSDADIALLLKSTPQERAEKIAGAFQQRLTPAAVAEARKLGDEARDCYDKAVLAAPSEPAPLLVRATSRMIQEGGLSGLLGVLTPDAAKGESTLKRLLSPAVVGDLRRARRLSSDEPETIVTTATMEFFFTLLDQQLPLDEIGTAAGWKKLPAAAQSSVIEANLRLVELTASPNKSVAASACEGAGILAFLRGQGENMETFLKRAAALRPLNARSIDLLTVAYLSNGRMAELESLYQGRIVADDSPRNRFLLAKTLARQGRSDAAELQLKTALAATPGDFYCAAALAALKLQAGDTAAAAPLLSAFATADAQAKLTPDQSAAWLLLAGIQQALTGSVERARSLLDAAKKADPGNTSIDDALAALG